MGNTESNARLTLVQGISRGDHMDWTIKKAVELGVNAIVPVYCERSMKQPDGKRIAKKQAHWRKIIINACEQCGRCVLPQLLDAQPLKTFLEIKKHGRTFILDPLAQGSLKKTLATATDTETAILVGPEGGFSNHELELAETAGYTRVTLGPRILRTETAGVVALSIIQAEIGDLA
jgi:16S rRNA (uracil1498-N3)-methyltransferase